MTDESIQAALKSAHTPVAVTLSRWEWGFIERSLMAEAKRQASIGKRSKWALTKERQEREAKRLDDLAENIRNQYL